MRVPFPKPLAFPSNYQGVTYSRDTPSKNNKKATSAGSRWSSRPPWISGPHSSRTTALQARQEAHTVKVRCKNGRSLVQFYYCSHAIDYHEKQPSAWEPSPRQSSFFISRLPERRWGRAHGQIKWRLNDTTQPTSPWKLNHPWVSAKPTAASSVGKPHSNKAPMYLVKNSSVRQTRSITISKRSPKVPWNKKVQCQITFIECPCAREVWLIWKHIVSGEKRDVI